MDPAMMNFRPAYFKVTVLMPVYNGERYLSDAMESILKQTFTDFEFLVIDDGSSDRSVDIVRSYADPRICLLENGKNRGLIATLNRGIAHAKGEYIARMDCDDISLPKRLERQVAFMDAHPGIGISGSWIKTFGELTSVTIRFPTEPERIRCINFLNSCVGHPSIIMRLAAVKKYNIYYDPAYCHAEDYALWVNALKNFDIANIGEVLHLYRQHPGQVTVQHLKTQTDTINRIRRDLLSDLGIEASEDEFALHLWLASPTLIRAQTMSQDVCEKLVAVAGGWFKKLKRANDERRLYPEPVFSSILFGQWVTICMQLLAAKRPGLLRNSRLSAILDILRLSRYHLVKELITICSHMCFRLGFTNLNDRKWAK
jgi:glycosyltransferase involved in cell wall biosynthesis